MTQPVPLCPTCVHFIANAKQCKPFPRGIPRDVLLSRRPHVVVLDDQTGDTVYEPIDEGASSG